MNTVNPLDTDFSYDMSLMIHHILAYYKLDTIQYFFFRYLSGLNDMLLCCIRIDVTLSEPFQAFLARMLRAAF